MVCSECARYAEAIPVACRIQAACRIGEFTCCSIIVTSREAKSAQSKRGINSYTAQDDSIQEAA